MLSFGRYETCHLERFRSNSHRSSCWGQVARQISRGPPRRPVCLHLPNSTALPSSLQFGHEYRVEQRSEANGGQASSRSVKRFVLFWRQQFLLIFQPFVRTKAAVPMRSQPGRVGTARVHCVRWQSLPSPETHVHLEAPSRKSVPG